MSPRTTAQFDEIRQQSRNNIKEAALELFGTYGYQLTPISKIAKAAGISKGLMYNYFDSKQDLLHAILLEDMYANEVWWKEILESELSAYEKIQQTIRKTIAVIQADFHHWQLLTSLVFQPQVLEGLEETLATKQTELMQQLTALFSELGIPEPEKEAMFYAAFLDGMFLHYMNAPDHYPLQEMTTYFLKKYEAYR
jgi:AcrR family transcriptional regulator